MRRTKRSRTFQQKLNTLRSVPDNNTRHMIHNLTVPEIVSAAAQDMTQNPDFYRISRVSSEEMSRGTAGCSATFSEAVKYAKQGRPEIAAEVKKRYLALSAQLTQPAKETIYDVTGLFFDVGEVLTGSPECWIDEANTATTPRRLTIYANIATVWSYTPDQYFDRGAGVLALVNALETAGAEVELIATMSAKFSTGKFTENITIKRFGEIADIDTIAFIFADASFFRRIVFGSIEAILFDPENYGDSESYGRQIDTPGLYADENTIVLDKESALKACDIQNHITRLTEAAQ